MPAWVVGLLWKFVVPDVITWLRAKGYINAAEDLAARTYITVKNDLKFYDEYPKEPR